MNSNCEHPDYMISDLAEVTIQESSSVNQQIQIQPAIPSQDPGSFEFYLKMMDQTIPPLKFAGCKYILNALIQQERFGVPALINQGGIPILIRILKQERNRSMRLMVAQIMQIVTQNYVNDEISQSTIPHILEIVSVGALTQEIEQKILIHILFSLGNLLRVSLHIRFRAVQNGALHFLSKIMAQKTNVEGMLQAVTYVLSELCQYQDVRYFMKIKEIIQDVLSNFFFQQIDIQVLINLCRCIYNSVNFASTQNGNFILAQLLAPHVTHRLLQLLRCPDERVQHLVCSILAATTLHTYNILGSMLNTTQNFQDFIFALKSQPAPKTQFAISYTIRQILNKEPEKNLLIINSGIISELVIVYLNARTRNLNWRQKKPYQVGLKFKEVNNAIMTEIVFVIIQAVQNSEQDEVQRLHQQGCVYILNSRLRNNFTKEVGPILQVLEKILVCGIEFCPSVTDSYNRYYQCFKSINVPWNLEKIQQHHPQHEVVLRATNILQDFFTPQTQQPKTDTIIDMPYCDDQSKLPSRNLSTQQINISTTQLRSSGEAIGSQKEVVTDQARSYGEAIGSQKEVVIDQARSYEEAIGSQKEVVTDQAGSYREATGQLDEVDIGETEEYDRSQREATQIQEEIVGAETEDNNSSRIKTEGSQEETATNIQEENENKNKNNNRESLASPNTRQLQNERKKYKEDINQNTNQRNTINAGHYIEDQWDFTFIDDFDDTINDYINDAENNAICTSVINNMIDQVCKNYQNTFLNDVFGFFHTATNTQNQQLNKQIDKTTVFSNTMTNNNSSAVVTNGSSVGSTPIGTPIGTPPPTPPPPPPPPPPTTPSNQIVHVGSNQQYESIDFLEQLISLINQERQMEEIVYSDVKLRSFNDYVAKLLP